MEWIPNLINQISVSSKIAFGLLCAGAFLLFAPLAKEGLFDPLTGLYLLLAWAVFVYSSAVLVFSLSQLAWQGLALSFDSALKAWRGRNITEKEMSFLEWAAHKGHQPVNLQIEMYKSTGIDQHRIIKMTESLHKKGLIEVSPYDRTIFTLTNKGRDKVLALPTGKASQS